MEEKEINPSQSLEIIQSMINTAKSKIADDGFHIIFRGWLVFSAALINYTSIILQSTIGYYVWPIAMPIGGIISFLYSRKEKKKENVKTYIEVYLGYLWIAFIIAMFITIAFINVNGLKSTYFFLMLLYGIATFITGGTLNFKPLVIGSLFSFAFAIISVFVGEKEQYLCIALALLFSYIVPGHLLKSKYKSQINV